MKLNANITQFLGKAIERTVANVADLSPFEVLIYEFSDEGSFLAG
jgi:hypothetical protein